MRAILMLPLLAVAIGVNAQQQMRLEVTLTGSANEMVYLANYYGSQLFYTDSAVTNAQGLAVFARKSGYKPGLYMVLPRVGRIPVVLNEPVVKLATTKDDPLGRLQVVQSDENNIHLVERKKAEALPATERVAALNELVSKLPDAFAAKLIRMEQEPDRTNVTRPDGSLDSTATSDLARAHYWDYTDLSDERIVNAPVFQNRLEMLLAVGIDQQADTITDYLNGLIARAGTNEALKKLILSVCLKKYAEMPTHGLGAVNVRLAQRHVCTGPNGTPGPAWTDDRWRKTCVKAAIKASLLKGAKARDIVLADTTGRNWVSMHAMPQSCVVVVFWSPHCSHCKQTMPVLFEKYQQELKALDVGFYTVAETTDEPHFTDWKAFIKEKKLDWVSVGTPWPAYANWRRDPSVYAKGPTSRESLNYQENWDAINTPTFYVLDRERRIVSQPQSVMDIINTVKALQAGPNRTQ